MNIRVDDPSKLQSYGAEVASKAEDYLEQIRKIYQILDDLSNTWQGTKSQNFKQKMDNCREEFTKFGDNLKNFGELIKATGAAYVQVESE
ncbi:MAG: WXG100 family type VII secretion target [Bacilli bacterium]|nr:WXG100 family type VII secretion target [Bacilli bacterium]